jgi:hypothetical protein
MRRFAFAALAAAWGFGSLGSAAGHGVIIADPATLMGCLCSEQGWTILLGRVDAAKQVFDRDRAAIEALDRQIDAARASLDVTVQAQVDAVKSMNLQREQLYARTYDIDFPRVQAAIRAYHSASGQYETHCLGQSFDPIQLQQAQANLSCPQQPQ